MKNSYFIKTFQLNIYLIAASLLIQVINIPTNLAGSTLLASKDKLFEPLNHHLGELLQSLGTTLTMITAILVLSLLISIIPEIITRISQDSLLNWFKSIWVSLRVRNFLKRQIDHEGEGLSKISKHNRAIWKTTLDVRTTSIVLLMKLPNNSEAQKMIRDTEEILREEISNRFPQYLFSSFERHQHLLIIKGTKKR